MSALDPSQELLKTTAPLLSASKSVQQRCSSCKGELPEPLQWTKQVPKGGRLLCSECASDSHSRAYPVPVGTFACCPTKLDGCVDADNLVLCCSGCSKCYHAKCMGICDPLLLCTLGRSDTVWFCNQGCGERHLKAKRRE